jgi:hypothetical protein
MSIVVDYPETAAAKEAPKILEEIKRILEENK